MPTRGGVILCGGRSRRMGRAKAWLEFGPERLLQRVVRLVASATDAVVVVAAPGQDLPDLPGSVRVVRDPESDQGPLRGLATGLAALGDGVELAYAAATDAPFLHPGWVDRLAGVIGDHDLALPDAVGRRHPLAALYRRGPTLAAAEALLAGGERRLLALADRLAVRRVEAADLVDLDPTLASLRNLNTPDDYRRASRDAGFAEAADDRPRLTDLCPPDRPG